MSGSKHLHADDTHFYLQPNRYFRFRNSHIVSHYQHVHQIASQPIQENVEISTPPFLKPAANSHLTHMCECNNINTMACARHLSLFYISSIVNTRNHQQIPLIPSTPSIKAVLRFQWEPLGSAHHHCESSLLTDLSPQSLLQGAIKLIFHQYKPDGDECLVQESSFFVFAFFNKSQPLHVFLQTFNAFTHFTLRVFQPCWFFSVPCNIKLCPSPRSECFSYPISNTHSLPDFYSFSVTSSRYSPDFST